MDKNLLQEFQANIFFKIEEHSSRIEKQITNTSTALTKEICNIILLSRSVIGAIGAPAPSHATLVKANGIGVSPNKLSMEGRLAQFLKPQKAAATSHAVRLSKK